MTEVSKPTIVAYLKPVCGWSNGVRAVFRKYELEYDDKDIINDRSNYSEMVRKSGQPLSPCVEIDGEMLADVSGQEVEQYLVEKGMVNPAAVSAGA
jgi:glutaredoxin